MSNENHDKKAELAEALAIKIVDLERYLREDRKEKRMSDQVFRAATSIGANIAESKYAESIADYIHKLSIAQKEANETLYWLRLLYKTKYIDDVRFSELHSDCQELLRIITNVILKVKKNQNK
ncbi:MAG: four helix bundle protein [Muribaculaceae bacterium]|nr:four helix bundle protein [Muribaculaceae bacterium]